MGRSNCDTPYSASEVPLLKDAIRQVSESAIDEFFAHVGDIKSGGGLCSESTYAEMKDILTGTHLPGGESSKPAFIIPGDNEWNDCSNPDPAWRFWETHLGRLEEHWTHGFQVERQAVRDENFAFVYHGALFIGINLVGGRVLDGNLWEQRMEQDADWVDEQFRRHGDRVSSVVLFAHAFAGGIRQPFADRFVPAAAALNKPVLYLMGNDHTFKDDHPFGGAPLVRRIIVAQGPAPLRITVTHDPSNPFQLNRDP